MEASIVYPFSAIPFPGRGIPEFQEKGWDGMGTLPSLPLISPHPRISSA